MGHLACSLGSDTDPVPFQTCSPCTRSCTCGTPCCWVTPPSRCASGWPSSTSCGTGFSPSASTSASCSSQTCQVGTHFLSTTTTKSLFFSTLSGGTSVVLVKRLLGVNESMNLEDRMQLIPWQRTLNITVREKCGVGTSSLSE